MLDGKSFSESMCALTLKSVQHILIAIKVNEQVCLNRLTKQTLGKNFIRSSIQILLRYNSPATKLKKNFWFFQLKNNFCFKVHFILKNNTNYPEVCFSCPFSSAISPWLNAVLRCSIAGMYLAMLRFSNGRFRLVMAELRHTRERFVRYNFHISIPGKFQRKLLAFCAHC